MYTSYYKLTSRPFQLSPNHRFFFGSKGHRRAMAYLTYGLHQREGFIVLTGGIGTGKTTLVDYLAEQLSAGPFVCGRVSAGQVEPSNVLAMVAKAFQLSGDPASVAELQGAIEAFLIQRNKARQRPLLIIDEAQNWPLPALEELRVLANLQHGGKALLQILMAGQPQFRDALAQPEFEQLRQRVVATHHLEALDDMEVGPYIEHRMRQVGWQGDPCFNAEAFGAIYEHTEGVPRRINLVCSRILVLSALEQRHAVDVSAVKQVIAELDQEGAPYEPAPQPQAPVNGIVLVPPVANVTSIAVNGKPCGKVAVQAVINPAAPVPADVDDKSHAEWGDVEHWRREVVRLLHKLERTYDDLANERRRCETIRVEADQLRERLHQMELEQLRLHAETSRRASMVIARESAARTTIFRRFGGN